MSIDDMTVDGTDTPGSVSRRTLMKTAAGAGIAAATIGAIGVAHVADTPRQTAAGNAARPTAEPVVVHVTDVHKGTIDVFTDGKRAEIHDADLAHRIVRAAQA